MTSAFEQLWKSWCEPTHREVHGEPEIKYVAPDGTERKITGAYLTREIQERRYNQYGGYDFVTTRTVRFPGRGSEDLSADGFITINKRQYAIETSPIIEADRIQLNLKRIDVGEITAPNHFRG